MLALTFVTAVTVAAVVFFAGWHLLAVHSLKPERQLTSKTLFDLVKLSFGVVAGAGALVALIVAYRRQRVDEDGAFREATRLHTERFTTAVSQLGEESVAVRLGGVHALVGLADDAPTSDLRQTCIDVLCAYLRLPYTSERDLPENDASAWHAFLALREVRHTVIRLIRDHLRLPVKHAYSWQDHHLDLTGVVFDGGDLSRARFSGGKVDLAGAVFSGGVVNFAGTEFSGGEVSFDHAEFSGGKVDFTDAVFSGGSVRFDGAVFSSGIADFVRTEFSGSEVDFEGAEFSGGKVSFHGAKFSHGNVDFGSADFSDGEVGFTNVTFSGAHVFFVGAHFCGSKMEFLSTRFSEGEVHFENATLSDGGLAFRGAKFSGSTVNFESVDFLGGEIDFGGAEFSGGEVDFGVSEISGSRANFIGSWFSGGTVDLSGVADLECIDLALWEGPLPDGLMMPHGWGLSSNSSNLDSECER